MVDDADRRLERRVRMLALAWIALLALMGLSLGSAYMKLGAFNMPAGLVIAAVKAAIVAWLFMRLREAGLLLRMAALAGLAVWAIQLVLTGVDYETRVQTPAEVQRPQQLLPTAPASAPADAR
jgi:cytochrome c oxidase subunit 4